MLIAGADVVVLTVVGVVYGWVVRGSRVKHWSLQHRHEAMLQLFMPRRMGIR
jgi:hypothetical protein